MIPSIHSPRQSKINFQVAKIPPRTVIITTKRGKDVISDEFIGNHVMRGNFVDLFTNMVSDIASAVKFVCSGLAHRNKK